MLESAPLVEAGLNAKKAQQARARTPRVKLDNGKTIDEIIADLALSREHREETAEELWPHFFALFARPIRCSAFRLGVPQLALPTSWPTLPSADACAPVRSPCGTSVPKKSAEQNRDLTNRNRIRGNPGRTSGQRTAKSRSIKGQGCRSGRGAGKAIELTWGGLRHVPTCHCASLSLHLHQLG
jgi:hypothetical protein